MQDFEVHPINTHLYLQLSRRLVDAMLEEQAQWGKIYPHSVSQALQALECFRKHQHAKQLEQN